MNEELYQINKRTFSKEELLQWCWETSGEAEEWEADHCMFILQWFNEDDYIKVLTSGSTGAPKEIRLQKKQMAASAKMTSRFFKLDAGSSALLCLPSKYIAGKMVIVRALVNKWHLHWVKPSLHPLKGIEDHYDTASFTPPQLHEIMNEDPLELDKIHIVLVGGGALPGHLESQLLISDSDIYLTYGMTETISHVAVRRIRATDKIFCALPGVQFRQNAEGCLVIQSEHLDNEVIETNDVVELIDEQNFIFLGRKDNVINSGGIKIFPEPIEKIIEFLFTGAYFIWKKADNVFGEKVVLYIEGKEWNESRKLSLLSYMEKNLQRYEVPKEIIFVSSFERTLTDKIIRKNYSE